MTCFVKDCKNIRRLLEPNSGITFHRFPTNEEAFARWLGALGKQNEAISWKKSMFICSNHFQPSDFVNIGTKRHLKKNACPTLSRENRKVSQTVQEAVPGTSKSLKELNLSVSSSCFAIPLSTSEGTPTKKRELSDSTDETASEPSPAYQKTGRLNEPSGSESSGSRKRKHFKLEHSYTVSPRGIQRKSQEMKKKYSRQSRKLYRANESVRKLKRKITSLSSVLKDLKSRHALSTFAMEHLEKSFGDIPHALMRRMLKNVGSGSITTDQYPHELRKFAITLHFYSCKAYEYVRRTFNLALPHPSTIRKWSSAIECLPGFSTLCFEVLSTKVREAENINQHVICSLLLDEIAIKKQIDFDGTRYWGYVDIGIDFKDDEVEPAQEALVLMVVSLNASWKLPIAYFFIKSLNAAEKSNVVKEALSRLSEIKVDVASVTCDGPTTHFSMFQQLGCDFKNTANLITSFSHPSIEEKIFSIFDICHMLKLIRSALADLGTIIDPEGNEIKWEFISKLYEIQEKETLLLANKLGKKHMEWRKQKMKVTVLS